MQLLVNALNAIDEGSRGKSEIMDLVILSEINNFGFSSIYAIIDGKEKTRKLPIHNDMETIMGFIVQIFEVCAF
jgi:hypothetical protein